MLKTLKKNDQNCDHDVAAFGMFQIHERRTK